MCMYVRVIMICMENDQCMATHARTHAMHLLFLALHHVPSLVTTPTPPHCHMLCSHWTVASVCGDGSIGIGGLLSTAAAAACRGC